MALACRVKVCGVTRVEDALLAAHLGASAIGFIFADSPRQVSSDTAASIIRALPPFVSPVGVFVNAPHERICHVATVCGLSTVQLHGEETPDDVARLAGLKVIKAIRVKDSTSLAGLNAFSVDAFLLDSYSGAARGGTGQRFNWDWLSGTELPAPVILAGGIRCGNVVDAIRRVRPYAVDVSSGVEASPGVKDHILLRRFFETIQSADILAHPPRDAAY